MSKHYDRWEKTEMSSIGHDDAMPNGAEFVTIIRQSLSTSTRHGRVLAFPGLLISSPDRRLDQLKRARATSEDIALGIFVELGFKAERTRLNDDGYPGLLRELRAPAPWIKVVPEDCDEYVSPDRLRDLRPLYQLVEEDNISDLLANYSNYITENYTFRDMELPTGPRKTIIDASIARFHEILGLAKCIGVSSFEGVADAIFKYDDVPPFLGAPDLLVWLPDSSDGLWFFAEVKVPNDSVRGSQRDWLKANWEAIRGRFILVLLE